MHCISATVIICVYNRPAQALQCVESLLRSDYQNFNIVIVDDCSTDETPATLAALKARHPDRAIVIVRNDRNEGVSGARNAGVAAASGEIVYFTDSDCTVDPGWLTAMIRPFDSPEVAAVAGVVRDAPPRTLAETAYVGTTILKPSGPRGRKLVGGNMGLRTAVAREYPFDPALRYGCDEDELAWRLELDGHRIAFAPDAVVRHDHPLTLRAYLSMGRRQGQGSARYWYKRGSYIGADIAAMVLALATLPIVLLGGWWWVVPLCFLGMQSAALVYNQHVLKEKPLTTAFLVLPVELLYSACKTRGYCATMLRIALGGERAIRDSKRRHLQSRTPGTPGTAQQG